MRWIAVAALVMAGAEGAAPIPGAKLFYTDSGGSGVPIVLMHAATGSVRAWEHQTEAFARAGYRVIAFDRRGWGRTTSEPSAAAGTAITVKVSVNFQDVSGVGGLLFTTSTLQATATMRKEDG